MGKVIKFKGWLSIKTITIFQTSDMHGYIFPTSYMTRNENQPFGLLKATNNYNKEKAGLAEDSSILISNGDTIQGSPFAHYLHSKYNSAGRLTNLFNRVGYDAGIPGNHEFNYGQEYVKEGYEHLELPILCANILNEQGEPFFGKAYEIFERSDIKIAVLGLTTQYIPHWEHPDHIIGLTFKSAVETAKEYVPMLSEMADVVVVSYHGGFEVDLDTLEPIDVNEGENEGYALIKEVEGIDVLLTGHQHNVISRVIDGVAVLMPGDKCRYLGKITLQFNKYDGEDSWTLVDAKPELIPTKVEDELLQEEAEYLAPLNNAVEDWLDEPVGKVHGDMLIRNVEEARIADHPYVEFIHRVQNYFGQTEISATSLFNNDAKGFPENVTIRNILNNYPFPNTLAVVKLTGAEIKAALELSAEFFMLDETGKIEMSPEWLYPKPKLYNYDMYEGIEYVVDVSKPVGERIVKLHYHHAPINLEEEFEVTLNQYRAIGGGDYTMFDSSKIVREVNIEMNMLIAKYFEIFKGVEATCNHNFRVVNGAEYY